MTVLCPKACQGRTMSAHLIINWLTALASFCVQKVLSGSSIITATTADAAPQTAAVASMLQTQLSSGTTQLSVCHCGSSTAVAVMATAQPIELRVSNQTLTVILQVARIMSAEPLANSAKLLKLKADLGNDDVRQIMAGDINFKSAIQCNAKRLLQTFN